MVAEHNHISLDDAFTMLRGYARSHSRPLRQPAEEILNGTLGAEALPERVIPWEAQCFGDEFRESLHRARAS